MWGGTRAVRPPRSSPRCEPSGSVITRQPISPSTGAHTGPGTAVGSGSSSPEWRVLPSGAVLSPSLIQPGAPGGPSAPLTGSYRRQLLFDLSTQSWDHTQYDVPSLIIRRLPGTWVSPRRSTPSPAVRPPPGSGTEACGMPFDPLVSAASTAREKRTSPTSSVGGVAPVSGWYQ